MVTVKNNESAPVLHTPEQPVQEVIIRPVEFQRETEQHAPETEAQPQEIPTEIPAATPLPVKKRQQHPKQIPQVRDELIVRIEKIMEDGLHDAYMEMTPVQKQKFKIEGEKTAHKIRHMVKSGKIKAKKVCELLLSWLKLIPGVNRFFLEQEAKIKTDQILSLQSLHSR